MPNEKYTVVLSGQRFVLTREQLESEPGSYLATYFLGDFKEAADDTREMDLERDPVLFKLIQSHLRGYEIFPLADTCIPHDMTKLTTLKNLLKDAEYFGLERLAESVRDQIQKSGTKRVYRIVTHKFLTRFDREIDVPERIIPLSPESFHFSSKINLNFIASLECNKCWKISKAGNWLVGALV